MFSEATFKGEQLIYQISQLCLVYWLSPKQKHNFVQCSLCIYCFKAMECSVFLLVLILWQKLLNCNSFGLEGRFLVLQKFPVDDQVVSQCQFQAAVNNIMLINSISSNRYIMFDALLFEVFLGKTVSSFKFLTIKIQPFIFDLYIFINFMQWYMG